MEDCDSNKALSASESEPRGKTFAEWKHDIVHATDIEGVMRAIRAYLSSLSADDLASLPPDVTAPILEGPQDVITRAVIAVRAEITAPAEADTRLLREMSLAFAAAATRLRYLMAANPRRT